MEDLEKKAKELEAKYHREWRQKNKNKVKEHNKRYWLKKALSTIQKEENIRKED